MSPRTLMLLPMVVVAAFLGITTLILLSGGDEDNGGAPTSQAVADPVAEALSVLPVDAPLVALVETDTAAGPLATGLELTREVPAAAAAARELNKLLGGIDLGVEVLPLLGNPLVVGLAEKPAEFGDLATLARFARAATVARDPAALREFLDRQAANGLLVHGAEVGGFSTYTREGGGAFALRGGLLVAAGSEEGMRAALALNTRARRSEGPTGDDVSGALTPSGLRERFRGLPGATASVLRVSADADVLVPRSDERRPIPWIDALRRVSFAVVPEADEGLAVPFRLATDAGSLTDGDVPIASGPAPPSPAAPDDAGVVLAFRDFAHTLQFVRRALPVARPELARQLTDVENVLRRFARVDPSGEIVAKLTETTTITTDLRGSFTMRSDLNDEDAVADALSRVSDISRLGSLAGGLGIDVDTGGITVEDDGEDRYRVLRNDEPFARIGVVLGTLVITNDDGADLEEIADAIPSSPPRDARGAFSARVDSEVVAELVRRLGLPGAAGLALGPLGDVTVSARGSVEGVSGTLRIALGDE